MTKSSSLRSLKKRRRSVGKRGSAKKERQKLDRGFLEEHPEMSPVEEAAVRNELVEHQERNKEWLPWLSSSKLTNFYSWCQSTVTEVSNNHLVVVLAGHF